jgi:hypothetical protein
MNGVERHPNESDEDWCVRLFDWMAAAGMSKERIPLDIEELLILINGVPVGPASSYTVNNDNTGSVTLVNGAVRSGKISITYPKELVPVT